MTRGNHSDLAREKNPMKKQELAKSKGADAKGANASFSTTSRMGGDAESMRIEKQKAAEEAAANANAKKVAKVDPLKMTRDLFFQHQKFLMQVLELVTNYEKPCSVNDIEDLYLQTYHLPLPYDRFGYSSLLDMLHNHPLLKAESVFTRKPESPSILLKCCENYDIGLKKISTAFKKCTIKNNKTDWRTLAAEYRRHHLQLINQDLRSLFGTDHYSTIYQCFLCYELKQEEEGDKMLLREREKNVEKKLQIEDLLTMLMTRLPTLLACDDIADHMHCFFKNQPSKSSYKNINWSNLIYYDLTNFLNITNSGKILITEAGFQMLQKIQTETTM